VTLVIIDNGAHLRVPECWTWWQHEGVSYRRCGNAVEQYVRGAWVRLPTVELGPRQATAA
jgi:hypothetical protein